MTIDGHSPGGLVGWAESGVLPTNLTLPSYYSNLGKLFESRPSDPSASALFQAWKLLPLEEKHKVCWVMNQSENPAWITALLADIVFLGIDSETDAPISDSLRSAVVILGRQDWKVCVWLLDHIAQKSIHQRVRDNARADAQSVRDRVRSFGR